MSGLDSIDKFRQTLTKEDFDRISTHIQHIFYTMAIKCKWKCQWCDSDHDCEHPICRSIIKHYDKLVIDTGVYGRKELVNIPAQKISEAMKATLKSSCINTIIQKNNLNPVNVYFYDDNEIIILETAKLGINSILVKDIHLQFSHLMELIKKKKDTGSVSLILIDFDKTFTTQRFRKRYLHYDIDTITVRFLGGKHRIKLLFHGLKKLEELGVKLGFITFHSKTVILQLLDRLEWLPLSIQADDSRNNNG